MNKKCKIIILRKTKLIITEVVGKNRTLNVCQNRNRALSLLIDEMAVCYPAPY